MHTINTLKKVPIERHEFLEEPQDWHSAEIGAALKMADTNWSALAQSHDLSRNTLRNAVYRPYPKAERIIAQAIGIEPAEIWPSRY